MIGWLDNSLGKIGDYWLLPTRFDKQFDFGISGQLGGTTSEFVAAYTSIFNAPPVFYDAVSIYSSISFHSLISLAHSVSTYVLLRCGQHYWLHQCNSHSQYFTTNAQNWDLCTTNSVQLPGNQRVLTSERIAADWRRRSPSYCGELCVPRSLQACRWNHRYQACCVYCCSHWYESFFIPVLNAEKSANFSIPDFEFFSPLQK